MTEKRGFWGFVSREVIDRTINRSGQERKLLCKRCNKTTIHVSISQSEGEDGLVRIGGNILDLVPGGQLLWGRPFRCTICNQLRKDV